MGTQVIPGSGKGEKPRVRPTRPLGRSHDGFLVEGQLHLSTPTVMSECCTKRTSQVSLTVSMSSADQASTRFLLGPTTPSWLPISLAAQQALSEARVASQVSAYRSLSLSKPVSGYTEKHLGLESQRIMGACMWSPRQGDGVCCLPLSISGFPKTFIC